MLNFRRNLHVAQLHLLLIAAFICTDSTWAQQQQQPAVNVELHVAAAADMQPVLETISPIFEKRSGIKLRISYASSATLAEQILSGAPQDIFLSASYTFAERVVAGGLAAIGHVELGRGRAHMAATDLAVTDFGNIPNALFHFDTSVNASCSFDIHWHGPVTSKSDVSTPGSTGELVMTTATMTWSGSNANGFKFESNPSGTTSVFGQLGHIKNGVFAD